MKPISFLPTDNILNICYDPVFKATFTRDTPHSREALKNLISTILDRDLELVGIINNEPPVSGLDDRQIRFDIAVKLETGELADVEMTINPRDAE
jgi:hypothetical protein